MRVRTRLDDSEYGEVERLIGAQKFCFALAAVAENHGHPVPGKAPRLALAGLLAMPMTDMGLRQDHAV